MSGLAPQTPGVPKTGPCAHDLSREQEFGGPAQVGAIPFWDRRPLEPLQSTENQHNHVNH